MTIDRVTVFQRAAQPETSVSAWSSDRLRQVVKTCLTERRPKVQNWGGSFVSQPQCLFTPSSVEQCCAVIELARRMGGIECRAVGRSHSPGDIVFTRGWLIRMEQLSGLISIDSTRPSIRVLAGTYLSDMHTMLEKAKVPLAMRNVGSISEQTIGGLIATASHGTGVHSPVLSAAVESMRVVCPLGPEQGGTTVLHCSRSSNAELFNATLCGLGATGLIVEVTLEVDYWFKLKQIAEECPFDTLLGPPNGQPAMQTWPEDENDGLLVSGKKAKRSLDSGREGESQENLDSDRLMASLPSSVSHDHLTSQGKVMPSSVSHDHLTSQGKTQTESLGRILARRPHLFPQCPADRLPRYRTVSAQEIYPIREPSHHAVAMPVLDTCSAEAQRRIEDLAKSSQHVRLAWVPQAGMVTVMRLNRTLEPIQTPSMLTKAYGRLVGYHVLQTLLFVARYRPSLTGPISRWGYASNHPIHPSPKKADVTSPAADILDETRSKIAAFADTVASRSASSQAEQSDAVDELASFRKGSFDPTQLVRRQTTFSSDPLPIDPRHARTVVVDAAPNVFNVDCLFRQYTNEWAIPMTCAAQALRVMRDWLEEEEQMANGERIHFPVEVRFVDADGIWLSPCNGRQSCYIGIVQYRPYNLPVRYRSLFAKFERLMRFFAGRPHWAKAHTCGPLELQRLYPNMSNFLALRQNVDPDGIFLNPYVRRHLLGHVSDDVSPRLFKSRI